MSKYKGDVKNNVTFIYTITYDNISFQKLLFYLNNEKIKPRILENYSLIFK